MNCIITKDESLEAVRERERERERESYTLETKRVALFDKLTHTLCLLNKEKNENQIINKYKKIVIKA